MTTQQNDGEVPGMTVGELRQALETLDPRLVVIVRFVGQEGADLCGGILCAGVEHAHDEDDTPYFAIDCTDDEEAFDE